MKWDFPKSNEQAIDGFNHSGQEIFLGEAFYSFGKEVLQNSNDVPLDPDRKKPVHVTFELIKIDTDEFPDRKRFLQIIKQAKNDYFEHYCDESVSKFYDRAEQVLTAPKLNVLCVSERNTTGMTGPFKVGKQLHTFSTEGISQKANSQAGGSRGMGKSVFYMLSDLNTLFVSTHSEDEEDNKALKSFCYGRSYLSGRCQDGEYYIGRGLCMLPDGGIAIGNSIPKFLRRSEFVAKNDLRGTSFLIPGVRLEGNWINCLTASIVSSFFQAIYNGSLKVSIKNSNQNDVEINSLTLKSLLLNNKIRNSLNEDVQEERLDNAKRYFQCIDQGEKEIINNNKLGKIKLHILKAEEGERSKLSFCRSGMLVTDKVDRLKQFKGFEPFTGVFECLDPEGMKFFRKLEGAKHDALETDRLHIDDREEAKSTLRVVTKELKEVLKKHFEIKVSSTTEISELAEFFPADDESSIKEDIGENGISNEYLITPRMIKSYGPSTIGVSDNKKRSGGGSSEVIGEEKVSNSKNGGIGEGEGSGPSDGNARSGGKPRRPLELSSLWSSKPRNKEFNKCIFFKPQSTRKNSIISVFIAGADWDEKVTVENSNLGKVQNGEIFDINLVKGKEVKLEFKINYEGSVMIQVT